MDDQRSLSERVIDDVLCRLKRIQEANGYRTNAGLRVFDSQHSIAVKQTPAVQVFEGIENATSADGSSNSMSIALQIVCIGHAEANTDSTGKVLRALKADIKKAVLQGRGAVGARDDGKAVGALVYVSAEPAQRQDGDTTESVTLTFSVAFREGYGDPYTQK